MRVIVCGGRDYDDNATFNKCMNNIHKKFTITEVIQGGARGADTLARMWAEANNISQIEVKADWKQFGRAAGMVRNKLMATMEPDAVIAFPGGRGTENMKSIAIEKKITLFTFPELESQNHVG